MFVFINPWVFYNNNDDESESSSGSESFHEEYHKKIDEKKYHGKSSKELLDIYLKDARFLTQYEDKHGTAEKVKEILKKEDIKKELLSKISKDDIAKKEKELKAQAKEAPIKAKANYIMNAETFGSSALALNLCVSALPGMAVIASSAKQESLAVLLAGTAITVGGLMAVYKIPDSTKAKNPEERKAIDDYYDVKHSLVALKQLKKAMKEEKKAAYKGQVGQLFAAGYGQPSGGLIQAAKLKNQGR